MEKEKSKGKLGKDLGFLFSYFVFTAILFFKLKLLNKLPDSWSYLHLMWLTLGIVLVGLTIDTIIK